MRDFLLIVPDDFENKNWNLDINVIDGYPEYMHFENQTNDQRAAVAAVQQKGTMPGMLDEGVDWTDTLDQKQNMITLDNQVKQNVKKNASGLQADYTMMNYTPIYVQNEDGSVGVTLIKS